MGTKKKRTVAQRESADKFYDAEHERLQRQIKETSDRLDKAGGSDGHPREDYMSHVSRETFLDNDVPDRHKGSPQEYARKFDDVARRAKEIDDARVHYEFVLSTASWMDTSARSLYDGKLFLVDGEHNPNIRYTSGHESPDCYYPFVEVLNGRVVKAFRRDEVKVTSAWKRFHKSDTLIYSYNELDTQSLTHSEFPTFRRMTVALQASPRATWQFIAKQFMDASRRIDKPSDGPMLSVMVETDEFYVALTHRGFAKTLESLPSYSRVPYDQLVENLAKELVAIRDFSAYLQTKKEGDIVGKKFNDFWPKDDPLSNEESVTLSIDGISQTLAGYLSKKA